MAGLRYHSTAARPDFVLTLPDGLDVSSGYTFTLRIGENGMPADLQKTSGLTGGVGVVTGQWSAGELANLDPGPHRLQLTATIAGLPRLYETIITIDDVILPAVP